jgi:hypothetical protein
MFFFLLLMSYSLGSQMLVFVDPGTYILKPQDYWNFDTITIYLYGTSGGSNGCNNLYPCRSGGQGGPAGSTICFLETKQQIFNLTIGKGGKGGTGDRCAANQFVFGQDGEKTSFTSDQIDITIMGGEGPKSYFNGGKGGYLVTNANCTPIYPSRGLDGSCNLPNCCCTNLCQQGDNGINGRAFLYPRPIITTGQPTPEMTTGSDTTEDIWPNEEKSQKIPNFIYSLFVFMMILYLLYVCIVKRIQNHHRCFFPDEVEMKV